MEYAAGAASLLAGGYKAGIAMHSLTANSLLRRGQEHVAHGTAELERSHKVMDADMVNEHLINAARLDYEYKAVLQTRQAASLLMRWKAVPHALRFERRAQNFEDHVMATSASARQARIREENQRRRNQSDACADAPSLDAVITGAERPAQPQLTLLDNSSAPELTAPSTSRTRLPVIDTSGRRHGRHFDISNELGTTPKETRRGGVVFLDTLTWVELPEALSDSDSDSTLDSLESCSTMGHAFADPAHHAANGRCFAAQPEIYRPHSDESMPMLRPCRSAEELSTPDVCEAPLLFEAEPMCNTCRFPKRPEYMRGSQINARRCTCYSMATDPFSV